MLQHLAPIELKRTSVTAAGAFSGYGAIFGNVDALGDMIERGAFTATLREHAERGSMPKMLLQHGGMTMLGGSALDGIPIGQWVAMEQDARGLKVEGQLFGLDTERGKTIYASLKSGALDGLSIGYIARGVRYGHAKGEPERTLTDIDLKEVSVVTFPANVEATVTSVKCSNSRELVDLLRQLGFSRRAAKAIAAQGWRGLSQQDKPESPDFSGAARELRQLIGRIKGDV